MPPGSTTDAAPTRIGRYRLVERLGQGGMATVWRAEDEQLRRDVALKLMLPDLAGTGEAAARFEREARAVAALHHPNILQIHDYAPASDDGARPAYLVAELIRGPTLKQFLGDHGAPLPEVAAMIGVKLARALHAAHTAGIIHRDVKPENVMIDRGQRVVLCDFGIARLVSVDSTMTRTGAVIGSPAYMSPEQAEGVDLDPRSDLFSLGTVLYQLSTGALPFQAPQPLALLAKIHRAEHAPPSVKNPRVAPYLERVIERCLRKLPGDRPADAAEIAVLLEGGLRDDGLGEIDRELADYFRDPPGYNAAAEPRIVAASVEQAKTAAARGETARAIGLCNRVQAWRPEDRETRALMARIGRRGRRRAGALIGAVAMLAFAGTATGYRLWARRAARSGGAALSTNLAPAPTASTAAAMESRPPSGPRGGSAGATPGERGAAIVPPSAAGSRADGPAPSAPGAAIPRPALRPPAARADRARDLVEKAAPGARAELAAAPPPTVSAALPATPSPPREGSIRLDVRPYCEGLIDGIHAIGLGRSVAVAPGPHRVECAGPPGTAAFVRAVEVAPGETITVSARLLAQVRVELALARGDQARIQGVPDRLRPGSTVDVDPGTREVTIYRGGAEVARKWIDFPAVSRCRLLDDPLECRKP